MFSRKTLGIAGAVIVGTVMGANAAHAAIVVGKEGTTGQLTYAKETLTSAVEVAGTKYYEVQGGQALEVKTPIGIKTTTARDITVSYTFGNMVLTEESKPSLKVQSSVDGNGATFEVLSGGDNKDDSVVFGAVNAKVGKEDLLVLSIGGIAVAADTVGTIDVTAGYLLAGLSVSEKVAIDDAVKTANALVETVSGTSATTLVDEDFMKFKVMGSGSPLKANLGSIVLGVKPKLLTAATSTSATLSNILGTAKVTFDGDISFADDVFLSDAVDCSSKEKILLKKEDGKKSLDTAALGDVNTKVYFCIEVDGKTAITPTDPYTATTSYTAITNAAFPPAGSEHELGSIMPDGLTVQIPYLTTYDGYNQRIVIVNRSSGSVRYALTFTPEEGVTAEEGDEASGMLEPNSTKTISLQKDDVVTITGGARVAATLSVAAAPSQIDVATVIVNLKSGGTDMVRYQ